MTNLRMNEMRLDATSGKKIISPRALLTVSRLNSFKFEYLLIRWIYEWEKALNFAKAHELIWLFSIICWPGLAWQGLSVILPFMVYGILIATIIPSLWYSLTGYWYFVYSFYNAN